MLYFSVYWFAFCCAPDPMSNRLFWLQILSKNETIKSLVYVFTKSIKRKTQFEVSLETTNSSSVRVHNAFYVNLHTHTHTDWILARSSFAIFCISITFNDSLSLSLSCLVLLTCICFKLKLSMHVPVAGWHVERMLLSECS